MSRGKTARLLLWAAATDRTFRVTTLREGRALVGKCIHCQRSIVVGLEPAVPTSATIEHIVPKHHGGTDALDNLALACSGCNNGKGRRLDHRQRSDPTLAKVIDTLLARRRDRLRDPPEGLALPPPPT